MTQSSRAIVIGGGLAGTLDLAAACVQFGLRGVPPQRIMQSIASGLLGPSAYQNGAPAALLGVFLHFLIACTAAAVFWFASVRIPWLTQNWIAAGMAFGVLVYLFMNLIVLPLSRFRSGAYTLEGVLIGIIVHMLCVGLPIAWAASRARV